MHISANGHPAKQHIQLRGRLCLLTLCATITLTAGCSFLGPSKVGDIRRVDPPIVRDDEELKNLSAALKNQREVFERTPQTTMKLGDIEISRRAYQAALDPLISVLDGSASLDEKIRYISEAFDFFEIKSPSGWGTTLVTGYYEPVIEGSTSPTARFSQPLYARPSDLEALPEGTELQTDDGVSVSRGRREGLKLVPYYSRSEIDRLGVLAGKGLEICYVDPIDAFFLHIQGSGTVRLTDGKELHLNYADRNGHPYHAIGADIRAKIAPGQMSMDRIIAYLRSVSPEERTETMALNPAYIFFRVSHERAITSLGVSATAGRTIATDKAFVPPGILGVLSFALPQRSLGSADTTSTPISRIVVSQDTGSAIKGPGRLDLFCGRGAPAHEIAGGLREEGRVLYLVPR